VRPGRAMQTRIVSSVGQESGRSMLASYVSERQTFTAVFYSDPRSPKAPRVVVRSLRELRDPDLLVYWSDANQVTRLDVSHAHLLGSIPAVEPLWMPGGQNDGFLIVYSLAHRAVVDSARVERLP
jgi:hypothetical protein